MQVPTVSFVQICREFPVMICRRADIVCKRRLSIYLAIHMYRYLWGTNTGDRAIDGCLG